VVGTTIEPGRTVPVPSVERREARRPAPGAVAEEFRPLFDALFPDRMPVRFRFWDGSVVGAEDGAGTVEVRSPRALRRLLWAPGELGVARAFVAGDLDVDGDLLPVLGALTEAGRRNRHPGFRTVMLGLSIASRMGAIGRPLPRPAGEARRSGRRHSRRSDSDAVGHHYDVGNDFYRLVLGPSLVYSCARFAEPDASLDAAQEAKLDLVCRKLGLDARPGARLLDVGCGWGSMAIHAARAYGARVVGITVSREQAVLARKRVTDAGLDGRVEIRLQDYRDVRDERFDAISSIGMSEHVGGGHIGGYFEVLRRLLTDGGRLCNHAISRPGGSAMSHRSFIGRYIFPDGELIDVGDVALAVQRAGLELRDVESLREHYVQTLGAWVSNLESSWDRAVAQVGEARARAWRLYMAASANSFSEGVISVHQVLAVKTGRGGASRMPPTRRSWD
jgi:cyclopropane-fatty-acyl-phospholipid synthase